uniref:Uncharacterized protein n=1 Tax=Roseihalotalea indica TaxID=2867963 RepID=A0AA49GPG4_9BACT|nr:hypothetical protein K4G66_28705 [Tunicatimonas sp. TK19036]
MNNHGLSNSPQTEEISPHFSLKNKSLLSKTPFGRILSFKLGNYLKHIITCLKVLFFQHTNQIMKAYVSVFVFAIVLVGLWSCENRATNHDAQAHMEEAKEAIVEAKEKVGDALEAKSEALTAHGNKLSDQMETEFEQVESRVDRWFENAGDDVQEEHAELKQKIEQSKARLAKDLTNLDEQSEETEDDIQASFQKFKQDVDQLFKNLDNKR